MSVKRIAILGSTGSIGRQAMAFVADQPALRVVALAAGNNWRLLAEQTRACKPEWVAIADPVVAKPLTEAIGPGTTVLAGPAAMTHLVREASPDLLLSGIVGSAGLAPTLAAIECGATLAIANKETLVMAGAIVMPAARAKPVPVLPVDSEHSAIFQCLFAGRREEVRHVTITASGGALRDWDPQRVETATVQDALNHPTWQMGRKITIDSATLMNKALEMIEAHWLFGLSPGQIQVVIHPESIIHSLVEFCDGSVMAQLARPDMTLPIAYALMHPARPVRPAEPPLDLAALGKLTFRPLADRFRRSVELGYEVIRRGGLSGAVVNGANEAAVEAFLAGRLRFGQIVPLVEELLNKTPQKADITLSDLLQADGWARDVVHSLTGYVKAPCSRVTS